MKIDGHPYRADTTMVEIVDKKGKTKVLTSAKAKESRAIYPRVQLSADEFQGSQQAVC